MSASAAGAVDAATATMISLIGSLADNKSALGRRYGEWAVSAPTIESAVAAAAMAQDELGHARATYPVLAKLGVSRSDEAGLDTGHPLPVISSRTARLGLVHRREPGRRRRADDVRGFRPEQLDRATRAARPQDPPGGGRPPGERGGVGSADRGASAAPDLALLVTRIEEMWRSAARWPGPDSDAGYADALALGMVDSGPSLIRARVRDWLGPPGRRRVSRRADGLVRLGRPVPPMTCPFCSSEDVELVAPWAGQMITSQMRCRGCNTYFEAIREEFSDDQAWMTSSADDR